VTDAQKTAVDALQGVINESAQLPMKSPLLAGLLSVVIPGLGKVYAGHPTDGLLSLISIATFTYASYDGFSSGGSSSTRGWVFGALASGLYLGNIYGSALSASIVRDEATRQLQTRVRASFALTGVP
jgi:TM2 domain-containing membrane protein YozV